MTQDEVSLPETAPSPWGSKRIKEASISFPSKEVTLHHTKVIKTSDHIKQQMCIVSGVQMTVFAPPRCELHRGVLQLILS